MDCRMCIQHFKHALRARRSSPTRVDKTSQLLGGFSQHQNIDVKSNDCADGQSAIHDHLPAKPQDRNNAHCGEPVCRRHDPGPLVDHTHPGSEHCHICRFKTLDLIIFPCESTDDLHTHHILLQAVRHFSDRIIHCEEKPADLCPETGCHQNQWKHRQQCNDRKPGVIRQHDVKDYPIFLKM